MMRVTCAPASRSARTTVGSVLVRLLAGALLTGGIAGASDEEATETMRGKATGTFEIRLTPREPEGDSGEAGLGRMMLDKSFHGDLEATSHGQMLAFRSAVDGSAGYVAMERVEGSLAGRRGSFVLQHSSTLTRGAPEQSIQVVPDSGTGDLAGVAGEMTIEIEGGEHRYHFTYRLE